MGLSLIQQLAAALLLEIRRIKVMQKLHPFEIVLEEVVVYCYLVWTSDLWSMFAAFDSMTIQSTGE